MARMTFARAAVGGSRTSKCAWVLDRIDFQRVTIAVLDDPTQITAKVVPEFREQRWPPVFGPEDHVVIQIGVGLGHSRLGVIADSVAP